MAQFRWFLALILPLCLFSPLRAAEPPLQQRLDERVEAVRTAHDVPAIAVLVAIDGRVAAETAVGERALGRTGQVGVADRWHIGSNGKAITATMIARLAERGLLRFDEDIASLFPDFAADIHPDYAAVTLAQLLSHRAGLPALTAGYELPEMFAIIAPIAEVDAQRLAVARHFLAQTPKTDIGEFAYSNLGYVIAGAAAERRAGKRWEDLVAQEVFGPLGIADFGFGAPREAGGRGQPLGHQQRGGELVAVDPLRRGSDNAPVMGPAGTINLTMRDWFKFADDQLRGVYGRGALLHRETYRLLHRPGAGNYAFGWGSRLGSRGMPELLTHSGSNGLWLANVRIMPRERTIVLIAVNAGGARAEAAVRQIIRHLRDDLPVLE